jgi:hypothetical protein
MSKMPERLTPAQAELLAEIRSSSSGGLWIVGHMRYGRTARALARKGYVRIEDSTGGQQFYVAQSTEPLPARTTKENGNEA